MEGIVDRFEGDRVVLEVSNRMLVMKRSLFPEELKEGDFVKFEKGRFYIDSERTENRKKDIDNLFDSLIDRE